MASAIVGASRPEQVIDNAAAADVKLTQDVVDAVDEALAGVAQTEFQLPFRARPGVTHR